MDILIRELDKWSITPEGSFSKTSFNFAITDKNFIGFGHEFKNGYANNDTTGITAFNTTYSIPNIRNTYISAVLHYEAEGNNNFNRSLAFDRPFYSPLTEWAAGVTFASQYISDSLKNFNSVTAR